MTAAELSNEDKNALRSGFPAIIYARLAGLSTEEAFQISLRAPATLQQQFQLPQQPMVFQLLSQFQLPPQQIFQLPPQQIFQLPPQQIFRTG